MFYIYVLFFSKIGNAVAMPFRVNLCKTFKIENFYEEVLI